jgi:hypothetical protein
VDVAAAAETTAPLSDKSSNGGLTAGFSKVKIVPEGSVEESRSSKSGKEEKKHKKRSFDSDNAAASGATLRDCSEANGGDRSEGKMKKKKCTLS